MRREQGKVGRSGAWRRCKGLVVLRFRYLDRRRGGFFESGCGDVRGNERSWTRDGRARARNRDTQAGNATDERLRDAESGERGWERSGCRRRRGSGCDWCACCRCGRLALLAVHLIEPAALKLGAVGSHVAAVRRERFLPLPWLVSDDVVPCRQFAPVART